MCHFLPIGNWLKCTVFISSFSLRLTTCYLSFYFLLNFYSAPSSPEMIYPFLWWKNFKKRIIKRLKSRGYRPTRPAKLSKEMEISGQDYPVFKRIRCIVSSGSGNCGGATCSRPLSGQIVEISGKSARLWVRIASGGRIRTKAFLSRR